MSSCGGKLCFSAVLVVMTLMCSVMVLVGGEKDNNNNNHYRNYQLIKLHPRDSDRWNMVQFLEQSK